MAEARLGRRVPFNMSLRVLLFHLGVKTHKVLLSEWLQQQLNIVNFFKRQVYQGVAVGRVRRRFIRNKRRYYGFFKVKSVHA